MITNYLQLAWRNLMANKTVSFINIFGLSMAVACCITVFLFLRNYWTLDNFHLNGDRIYIVEYQTETNGERQCWGDAPAPMAQALASDFPQVERSVRIRRDVALVSTGDHIFEELIMFADTGFFDMFTFPLQYGSASALKDPAALVLSAQMAEKFFKGENALGRTVYITLSNQRKMAFTVQAVAAPFPPNSDFNFDFLAGYRTARNAPATDDWGDHDGNVFVQLRRPEDAAVVAAQMNRYLPQFNARNQDNPALSFLLDNLKNPAPGAYDTNRRPAEAPHPAYASMLSAIALLLLALSCFNYINISLGTATRRLREIGVRKVMGGKREQLIAQFMSENLLLCFIALSLGLLLCKSVFAPMMNDIMVINVGSMTENASLWYFLTGLLAFTALASGLYPAFYISGFRPTLIFTGKQKFSDKSTFRRGLLTAQFTLAFLAVIVSVLLLVSGKHWSGMSWGYSPDQTYVVQLTDSTQYALLKNELLKNPHITQVASSVHHGMSAGRKTLKIGETLEMVRQYDIGAGYLEVLGMPLASGRSFQESRKLEDAQSIVVNEAFVAKQGWSNPLGQYVRVDDKNYTVVGVTKNCKLFPTGVVRPLAFFCAPDDKAQYLLARISLGAMDLARNQILEAHRQLFGSPPIAHYRQSEVFDAFNTSYWGAAKTFGYIAILALVISCMGLYGLATQQFARRIREVSIRKLLGAPVSDIVLLVNREFLILLAIAGAVATVLSYAGMLALFDSLRDYLGDYKPGFIYYLMANLIVFITAIMAIGQQSWRLVRVELAKSLKNSE